MSNPVLVAYATAYGSTQEVAEAIAETLRAGGLSAEVKPAKALRSLEGYGAVVLGAPLFMFRWHRDAHRFLVRQHKALAGRRVVIFALGPVHDPYDEAEWQGSQEQLDKALAKHPWLKPLEVKLFGGKYDPTKLRFPLSLMAGAEPASDIRDWEAIRAWAQGLLTKLV